MKKTGIFLLLLSSQTLLAATDSDHQQRAVENGLSSPIAFQNEEVKSYSVYQRLAHYKIPAVSFALIDDGELAWAQAYGTVSANSKEKVTVDTVLQAASIAKPVTAYAVMRMKDEGLLNINTDINEYLSSFTLPESSLTLAAKVTFKNLLDHSSGLTGGGYEGYDYSSNLPTKTQTFWGQKPANNNATEIVSKPGTTVSYSGAGYTLAQIALTDVFEMPFENIMDTWVLSKLSMHKSSFSLEHPNSKGIRAARGHNSTGNEISGGWKVHPEQAAAGLWSTPGDLAKLAIDLSAAVNGQSKLLSQASAQEMLMRILPEQDFTGQFGGHPAMTFVIAGADDQLLFKHGGGTAGYRCFMLMYPATGDGAIFMTNSDAGFGVGLEMLRAASDVYHWPDYKATTYQRRKVNAKEQINFIGEYHFDAGWKVNIVADEAADGLAVVFPNDDIYPLSAVNGMHNYIHVESGVEVSFDNTDAEPVLLLYNQFGVKQ